METESKNGVKNAVRPQNKHLKPFKKGENMGSHRPKGQKNYETLRREAIIAIGQQNGKTPEEIEIMLHSVGLSNALKGDFRFYKDDLDRVHGQAVQRQEIAGTLKVEKLEEIQEATKSILGNG